MPASAAERWPVIRARYEDGVPVEELSILTSLTARALLQRAAREEWSAPGGGDAARLKRIRDLQDRIAAEVDAAMADVGETGLDKARIEMAAALMKILDRLMESERALQLARQQAERTRQAERDAARRMHAEAATREEDAEGARESQKRRDAETAEILHAIEEQIVALARDYARKLVQDQEGSGKAGAGRP